MKSFIHRYNSELVKYAKDHDLGYVPVLNYLSPQPMEATGLKTRNHADEERDSRKGGRDPAPKRVVRSMPI